MEFVNNVNHQVCRKRLSLQCCPIRTNKL